MFIGCLWLLTLWRDGAWSSAYSVDRFQSFEIKLIESPTALLQTQNGLYLTADVLDPRPGLYRLSYSADSGYQASLLRVLPRADLQGISLYRGDLLLSARREFSEDETDWRNYAVLLESAQYRPVDRWSFDLPNRCPNGTYECGLSALISYDEDSLLAVTAQSPARLYWLKQSGGEWLIQRRTLLQLEGKNVTVSAAKRVGDDLVFLIKNRWMLARTPWSDLAGFEAYRMTLDVAFDFQAIKRIFRLESRRFEYGGYAEGFAVDSSGVLMILLNNRSYKFRKSPDGALTRSPRLVIFPSRSK